jgi:hypothetical protein
MGVSCREHQPFNPVNRRRRRLHPRIPFQIIFHVIFTVEPLSSSRQIRLCRCFVPILLSPKPDHFFAASKYARLQSVSATSLRIRRVVHVPLPGFSSSDDLFRLCWWIDFHGLRIPVRTQRSRVHHMFGYLVTACALFHPTIRGKAATPFNRMGRDSAEPLPTCRISTDYTLFFTAHLSVSDIYRLPFGATAGMECQTGERLVRNIYFIFLRRIARLPAGIGGRGNVALLNARTAYL